MRTDLRCLCISYVTNCAIPFHLLQALTFKKFHDRVEVNACQAWIELCECNGLHDCMAIFYLNECLDNIGSLKATEARVLFQLD